MTEVVRGALAKGPMAFPDLWRVVELAGGNKFALKSALGKGRERGEYHFNGELYSSKPFGTPKKKKVTDGTKRTEGITKPGEER